MKQSAGILVYRQRAGKIEVLLAHPGGPHWARRDTWSIPKGEVEADEDLKATAFREFQEETNIEVPVGELLDLGTTKQGSVKVNYIWAVEGNPDISNFKSNTFRMEWPPKSGKQQEFPENDRVAWFPVAEAKCKVYKVQQVFFDRLTEQLCVDTGELPEQQSLI